MSEVTDYLKHTYPELNPVQVTMLESYIKGLRVKEIEDYADFLSDQEEEAAFELAWQEYAYKRTRQIDAEGADDGKMATRQNAVS